MLDHVFLTVSDLPRQLAFYTAVLPVLGLTARHDYAGADGPPGHPDLYGFGGGGRMVFWLQPGISAGRAVHIGLIAASPDIVRAAHAAAIAAGAVDNPAGGGPPGARLHYDPRYFAANVFDPEGTSLEFVHKSWQHPAAG